MYLSPQTLLESVTPTKAGTSGQEFKTTGQARKTGSYNSHDASRWHIPRPSLSAHQQQQQQQHDSNSAPRDITATSAAFSFLPLWLDKVTEVTVQLFWLAALLTTRKHAWKSECRETSARYTLFPPTPRFSSATRRDIWITSREQFSCVNWTDETGFTIFFSMGEQNTIDFSSAGGLRNTPAFLKREQSGDDFSLNMKYLCLCVCVCVC